MAKSTNLESMIFVSDFLEETVSFYQIFKEILIVDEPAKNGDEGKRWLFKILVDFLPRGRCQFVAVRSRLFRRRYVEFHLLRDDIR